MDPSQLILNEAGTQALIRYHFQQKRFIEIPNKPGVVYIFVMHGSMCAAWVNLEDVDYILGLKSGCCGQKKAGVFFPADQLHAERWAKWK